MRRALLAVGLAAGVACGGGGGGGGTTTGISRGVITGIAPDGIAVNGVVWNTDAAAVDFDGTSAVPGALEVGMRVTVRGDRSGSEGQAELIEFDPTIVGPIDEVTEVVLDGDGEIRRLAFEILGRTVVVEPGSTVFDDSPVLTIDSVSAGDFVEISGFGAPDGGLRATRLELLGSVAPGAIVDVELQGRVAGSQTEIDAGSFRIGALDVTYDPNGVVTDLPGGVVVAGDFVEVKGSYDPNANAGAGALAAVEIERESQAFTGDAASLEIEGLVLDFTSFAVFEVDGQAVDASQGVVRFDPGNAAFVEEGARIEVEGQLQANVSVARAIASRDVDVRLAAEIPAGGIDVADDALTLLGVTVRVDAATRFVDEVSALDPFALEDLSDGDFIAVRGVQTAAMELRALEIVRRPPGGVLLSARVQTFSGPALPRHFTLLGVEVETDGSTSFIEFPAAVTSEESFYLFLASSLDVRVEVEDPPDGDATAIDVADEVELEPDDD